MTHVQWQGYLRKDGRKGIRNYVLVVYLTKSTQQAARKITSGFKNHPVRFIGFTGTYPAHYNYKILHALCTHPNVGGVLLLTGRNENLAEMNLDASINESGRPVHTIVFQKKEGYEMAINEGVQWIEWCMGILDHTMMVPMRVNDLIIGSISAGNAEVGGITANHVVGQALDKLVSQNGTALFGLIGIPGGLDVSASAEIVSMTASGCHIILSSTGTGTVGFSIISPLIRISADPKRDMSSPDEVDINVGGILQGEVIPEDVCDNVFEGIILVAAGISTCSEGLRR